MKQWILRPGIIALIVIAIIAGYIFNSSSIDPLVAPIDKEKHTLHNYLGQGRVLVEFWASWCHFCAHQVSIINQVHKDLPNISIIGIQIDQDTPTGEFNTMTYPTLHAINNNAKPIMRFYGNYTGVVPFIVILDKDGNMIDRYAGETSADELEKVLR